jgi:flagellar M-ring protein FliF
MTEYTMSPLKFFNTLGRSARIGLLMGVAIIALSMAGALWWAFSPREQLLFGGLKEADAAEIVAALEEWKIPHAIVDGGTGISVPDEMVYAVRMRLVSSGIPKGGHVGFELFDDSDFGVTEFAQRVNYQRALQGEIERTIAALPGVETARVHLSIRRPGLFVGDQEASKASVALSMRAGQSLARQQVRGIRSLVSAAVEGLSVDRVAVLDSNGALLAGGEPASSPRGVVARDDEETEMEARIHQRLSDLIGHALGSDTFSVSVDVVLNYDTVREINERPIGREPGNLVVARKRVNTQGATDDDGKGPSNEDIEYVNGSVREEIVRAPGAIQRLSVAAILPSSLSDQDVERMRTLIAAAAGIVEERGDRIEVSRIGPDDSARGLMVDEVPSIANRTANDPRSTTIDDEADGWLWAAMLLTLGLTVGGLGALLLQRKPEDLSPGEREAALAKLRAWLADGSVPS